jgi:hypothetical protein
MFGTPSLSAVPCSEVQFNTPSHSTALSWIDAYAANLFEAKGFGFNAATSQYFSVGPDGTNPDRNQIEPWYGYWFLVRTTEPLTISIPCN